MAERIGSSGSVTLAGSRVGGGATKLGGESRISFASSVNKSPSLGPKTSKYNSAFSQFRTESSGLRINRSAIFGKTSKPDIGTAKRTEFGFTNKVIDRTPKPNVMSERFARTVRQPDATLGQLREPKVVIKGLSSRPTEAPQKRNVEPVRRPDTLPVRPAEIRSAVAPVVTEKRPNVVPTRVEQIKQALAQEAAKAAPRPAVESRTAAKPKVKAETVAPQTGKKEKIALKPKEAGSYMDLMKKRLAKRNGPVAPQTVSEAVVIDDEENKKKKKKNRWTLGESWRKVKSQLLEKTKSKTSMQQMMVARQAQKQELTQVVAAPHVQTEAQTQTQLQVVTDTIVQTKPDAKVAVQVQNVSNAAANTESNASLKVVIAENTKTSASDEEEVKNEKYAIDDQTQKNREEVARRAIWLSFTGTEADRLAGEEIAAKFKPPSVDTTSGLLREEGMGPAVEAKQFEDPTDKDWRKQFAERGFMTKAEAHQIVVYSIDSNRAVRRGEGKRASEDEVEKVRGKKKADALTH